MNQAGPTKLQVLVPGETAVAGSTTGKAGTPRPEAVAKQFKVTVNGTDNYYNIISSDTKVFIQTDDPYDVEPATQTLVSGTSYYTVILRRAQDLSYNPVNVQITAKCGQVSQFAAGLAASVAVTTGTATKLLVILPGETPVPGLGKTGAPSQQKSGQNFDATVNLTDAYWNKVKANATMPSVTMTSNDPFDTRFTYNTRTQQLANGTKVFGVTPVTVSSITMTATDNGGAGTAYRRTCRPGCM